MLKSISRKIENKLVGLITNEPDEITNFNEVLRVLKTKWRIDNADKRIK